MNLRAGAAPDYLLIAAALVTQFCDGRDISERNAGTPFRR